MTPADELKRKAATFESSAAEFESERQRLSDLLSIDRKRLLGELDAETDRVWNGARAELRLVMANSVERSFEANSTREHIAAALFRYFEQALDKSIRVSKAKLDERAAGHSARDDALVDLVRQTAADLMEVSVSLPRSEEAFQSKSDPYWVAPEPAISLLGLSAALAGRRLPRVIREKRARAQLIAEADRAALRNVANLDWAMRQNIEDSFRRFEVLALRPARSSAEVDTSGNAVGARPSRRKVGSRQGRYRSGKSLSDGAFQHFDRAQGNGADPSKRQNP